MLKNIFPIIPKEVKKEVTVGKKYKKGQRETNSNAADITIIALDVLLAHN